MAPDPAIASSCFALAGRAAHAAGDLSGADELLGRALAIAPTSTQAMIGIWYAPLLVDQGQAQQALDSLADPATVIADFAEAQEAAVVVVGARGHRWLHDRVLGSTSQKLVHHCTRPVLVVHKPK